MRSDLIKKGFEKAPHRSLLRATGQIKNDKDFDRPFIGVANSYIDLIPRDSRFSPPTDKYLISESIFLSSEITSEANLSPESSPVSINTFFILLIKTSCFYWQN